MGLLMAMMPDNVLPLLIVLIGIALIIGIISRNTAFGFLGIIILFALLMPFIDALFDHLPAWLLIVIMVIFVLSVMREILNLLFGKGATDEFVGHLMYEMFMLPFRLIRSLFRRRRMV